MQTCSRCHTQSNDSLLICPKCHADLREFSTLAVSLQRILQNPRILAVRVAVPHNACPVCLSVEGTYPKEKVPTLPVEGCSEPGGCRAYYEPLLEEIYP